MDNYTYEQVACSHVYFPNNPSRTANRIVMKTSDQQIAGWADYLIEDGWSKFLLFFVAQEHREQTTIETFLNRLYLIVGQPKQTFWWAATPQMEKYFERVASVRPDITFAAGGSINRIIYATP